MTASQIRRLSASEDERSSPVSSPSIRREMREQGIAPDSVTGTGKGGRITLNDLSAGIEREGPAGPCAQRRIQRRPCPQHKLMPLHPCSAVDALLSLHRQGAIPAVSAVRSEEAPSYNSSREVAQTHVTHSQANMPSIWWRPVSRPPC